MRSATDFALLRDGGQVLLRGSEPADGDAIARLLASASPADHVSSALMGSMPLEPAGEGAADGRLLVAELHGVVVAAGMYRRVDEALTAEAAVAVAEAQRGNGVGTVMLERLVQDARRAGILRLRSRMQPQTAGVQALLGDLGFPYTQSLVHGAVEVEIDLDPGPEYLVRADERRHVAAVASLQSLFHPRAVAVVGASRRAGSIGEAVFSNLLQGGFAGRIYPVNPAAPSVLDVAAYPSVGAIPDTIDLALLVVPAAKVFDAARDSLQAGARALVVISAGFAETGDEGRHLQDALLALCRSYGARLVGPNSLGIFAVLDGGAINATFAPMLPPPGVVAMSSQSGALGVAILEHARARGLGVSAFVSVGNKADLSSNDLLEYWEEDPATRVIVLYLESFGNPRRFARIARRVGLRKPILAVKSGRSAAGRRAAASHTAALAGSDVAVEALFRQAGVTRADTLQELCEVATLFAYQPLPAGSRVAVMTNAGGIGILCADACEANGLELPSLSTATRAVLAAMLPREASLNNPIDMVGSATGSTYSAVLRVLIADPDIDAVIVLFTPPRMRSAQEVADAVLEACDPAPHKPVVTCFVGCPMPETRHGSLVIPSYAFPESAARALGQAAARAAWLRAPAGSIPPLPEIDRSIARRCVAAALARGDRTWLGAEEIETLLHAYGVALLAGQVVHSAAEAAAACARAGEPVAVKLVSSTVLHKSDAGGVHLNVASPTAAAAAYDAIAASLAERGLSQGMEGVLVQPMVAGGVECLVGVVRDPIFGPLIAFGAGGVNAEVFNDVAFRLHPLTDVAASELIDGVKVARLLRGYRGAPAADVAAVQDLLLRVSRLVEDVPEIVELDLNPVLVRTERRGAVAVDARICLAREG